MLKKLIAILGIIGTQVSFAQNEKIGLVLSGGGSNGIAHIGVIKFLEENNIPIDYISGTSMGALIGAMYASGYTIEEIEDFFISERFKAVATGEIIEQIKPYYKKNDPNPSFFTFKISKDTIIEANLPTNFINPSGIDFELLRFFSQPKAAAGNNFDKLMIPYRCVAADIISHTPVVFKTGDLDKAVRASMSYPFYINALKYDSLILMDGGIFNNFPVDVMQNEFQPDIIIGSDVSDPPEIPDENNVISQIKSLIINRKPQELSVEKDILIQPDISNATFDFSNIPSIIQKGYEEAEKHKYEILEKIRTRKTSDELQNQRTSFRKKFPPVYITDFEIIGLNRLQSRYVKSIMRLHRLQHPLTLSDLEKRFYRLLADDKIKEIEPLLRYDKENQSYNLILNIKKEKDIFIDFGGNLSSLGVNQGYLGVQYNYIGRTATTVKGNIHFGKFNTSLMLSGRFDIPLKKPLYIETKGIINNFNYFTYNRQFNTEEIKPTFVKTGYHWINMEAGMPLGKNAVGGFLSQMGTSKLEYFNTPFYTSADTADVTFIDFFQPAVFLEYNTLNYKQFPSDGHYMYLGLGYADAYEYNIPGTTSQHFISFFEQRKWLKLKIKTENYYLSSKYFKMGSTFYLTLSNAPLLRNYYSTLLYADAYYPTIESRLLFIESYRAFSYLAFQQHIILSPFNKFQLRVSPGIYIPYQEIQSSDYYNVHLSQPLKQYYITLNSTLLYQTPVGPVSLSFNYYQKTDIAGINLMPATIFFNFGYVIFNKKPF